MPTAALRAHLSDQDLTQREQHRVQARRGLPDLAATARVIALAICEVEAGLRSASQLERVCHHSLWQAVAVVRRGQRVAFVALRLEAVPGRWEVIELLY